MTMTETALILAERSAPRYTSYPTAPHFAPMGDEAARGWLAALPAQASLSLYLHVPYCSAICTYCGCNTKAVRRSEPLDAYAATLEQEMALLAGATGARRVTHIHWGGGTPSLMGPERLLRLRAALGQFFDLSNVTEHAIELDPRTVDADLARALEAGRLPVAKGCAFSSDDLLRASVIERLMCDFAVDFGALAREAGDEAALDDAIAQLDVLAQDGVMVREGRTVRVTEHGQPFVRLVAAAFDAYLDKGAARHSVAV